MKITGEAQQAFEAAEKAGVRQEILTAAAERFKAAQISRE